MKTYAFGVDIGGTTIKMGFFETSGKLLDKWEIKTDTSDHGVHILEDVAHAINDKLEQKQIAKEDVCGVGVGVPGPVTNDGTVNGCVNLGWGVFQVAQELQKQTGLKVKVGNDANVAALGEMWQGGGKGHANVVVVTLGTGVGGGIIIDGKMVAGADGAGGEIGHIMVREDEKERCGCGKCGCLEQYASATGIVRMAKRKLASTIEATSLRETEDLTAKDIFDAAKAGDAMALELTDELGRILGTALANIACTVNPEIFVIGGGVSKAGTILTENVQKHFIERAFHACKKTQFALAALGNDAGIYGCVRMLLSE